MRSNIVRFRLPIPSTCYLCLESINSLSIKISSLSSPYFLKSRASSLFLSLLSARMILARFSLNPHFNISFVYTTLRAAPLRLRSLVTSSISNLRTLSLSYIAITSPFWRRRLLRRRPIGLAHVVIAGVARSARRGGNGIRGLTFVNSELLAGELGAV